MALIGELGQENYGGKCQVEALLPLCYFGRCSNNGEPAQDCSQVENTLHFIYEISILPSPVHQKIHSS